MRVFRSTYRDRNGKTRATRRWYLELRDHTGVRRRFSGFTDKEQTAALGRQIERLVNCRGAGETPDVQLSRWLESASDNLRGRLLELDLISGRRVAAATPLSEHMADFIGTLKARGRSNKYIRQVECELRRVFAGCRFAYWSDISASRLELWLGELRDGGVGISARSYNSFLKVVKQFARWMVRDGRAVESPLTHLPCLNTETDRRRERRSLEVDEARRLLEATAMAPERFGMAGGERSVLYRLAIESGLRAGEIRTLRVDSFDFDRMTVCVRAGYSKRRREDVVPIRPDTADVLRGCFADKLPTATAFNMPSKERIAPMLKADLADAGLDYVDGAGRYCDFHSLRHTTASWLAAAGVHPRVAQSILRHSDVNLTLSRYSHVLRGQESGAVAALPDLALPSEEAQRATGTDEKNVTCVSAFCLARLGEKGRTLANSGERNDSDYRNDEIAENGGREAKNDVFEVKKGYETETGEPGFEPELTDPESVVLPLHYSPIGLTITATQAAASRSCQPCSGDRPDRPSACQRPGRSIPASTAFRISPRIYGYRPTVNRLLRPKLTRPTVFRQASHASPQAYMAVLPKSMAATVVRKRRSQPICASRPTSHAAGTKPTR